MCTPTAMSMYALEKGSYQLSVKDKKDLASWSLDLPYSFKSNAGIIRLYLLMCVIGLIICGLFSFYYVNGL